MPVHPNVALLKRFYRDFAVLDADGMEACYAPDCRFEDEVFKLRGRQEVAGMWRMLCAATWSKGLDVWKLEFSDIEADDVRGRALWEAHYRFSATGRIVHNRIAAEFEFQDGLIVAHRDRFNFWDWSKQALGTPGWLLGWTPLLRVKIRSRATASLKTFLDKSS